MQDLIGFYLDEQPNPEGRTLSGIWAMSDDELMDTHDVVQWLFPLPDKSQFNPSAPLLTPRHRELFLEDPRLKRNLLKSFHRFLGVFGLAFGNGQVYQVRHVDIWMSLNHNWLRFTRILKCLTLLGLPAEALAFFDFLLHKVGDVDSLHYWRAAVGR